MAATNINRVVLTGNLTRDPELRSTPSGTSVCSLRIACNTRRKDASGEWEDQQGNKRQAVDIIADSVQFLGSRDDGGNGSRFTPQSDVPADTADFDKPAPVSGGAPDDDIPF